jgi:hypothetical protein
MAYMHLMQNGANNAVLAYSLLLAEARESGVVVSDGDVDLFMAQIGFGGARYERLLSQLRAANETWTEAAFRATIRDWLAIAKHYADVGDFIIKGIQGEAYPCKPDIFEETYEPA